MLEKCRIHITFAFLLITFRKKEWILTGYPPLSYEPTNTAYAIYK